MQQVLSDLELLITYLPQIERTLGRDWPNFARRMRQQATSFESPIDEASLTEAVNDLLDLFLDGDIIEDIITSSGATETMKRPQPETKPVVPLHTIANRFYLLCQEVDKFIEHVGQGGDPNTFFEQADVTDQKLDLTQQEH